MDKQVSELFEVLTGFVNETAADVRELEAIVGSLKAAMHEHEAVAKEIEQARAELTIRMYELTSEANRNARERAERAQKELADISELMAVDGSKKIVKLVHDAEGRTQGAIVIAN